MGVRQRFWSEIKDGVWGRWRHRRRSYLLALFGSVVVPFGIIYSGLWATGIILFAWIAFLIKFVDVLDGIQPAEDQIGVYLAFMGTLVAMHLIVPVIAVWWHNRHCRLKDEAQGAASENE